MSKLRSAAPAKPRVVISDASCLIDLHKVGLIPYMLALPYEFQVAHPVRVDELLTITPVDWDAFAARGLVTVDLPGEAVSDAFGLKKRHPALSTQDCMSLVLARSLQGSLLLTSDGYLRTVSQGYQVEVHGILWVLDELHQRGVCDPATAYDCLTRWRDDPLVWLPATELAARIKRFSPAE